MNSNHLVVAIANPAQLGCKILENGLRVVNVATSCNFSHLNPFLLKLEKKKTQNPNMISRDEKFNWSPNLQREGQQDLITTYSDVRCPPQYLVHIGRPKTIEGVDFTNSGHI